MIQGSGKKLGIREQQRIAAKTGLDPAKIIRMAEKQGLKIKTPKGAGAEQDNQTIDNQTEGNINGENDGSDWSARFDELNAQWEDRFKVFEDRFNKYETEDNARHEEVSKKMEDLRSDSSFNTGSLTEDGTGAGNKYDLDRKSVV